MQRGMVRLRLSKAITKHAVEDFVYFKTNEGNTNRGKINLGIMCAFVKKVALEREGLDINNHILGATFEIDATYVTKGVLIVADAGFVINYDPNLLLIQYVRSIFNTLLPTSPSPNHLRMAIFLCLFVSKYCSQTTTQFVHRSIAAWAVYRIVVDHRLIEEIVTLKLYESKVKLRFVKQRIVSRVNLGTVDKALMRYHVKLKEIMNQVIDLKLEP